MYYARSGVVNHIRARAANIDIFRARDRPREPYTTDNVVAVVCCTFEYLRTKTSFAC